MCLRPEEFGRSLRHRWRHNPGEPRIGGPDRPITSLWRKCRLPGINPGHRLKSAANIKSTGRSTLPRHVLGRVVVCRPLRRVRQPAFQQVPGNLERFLVRLRVRRSICTFDVSHIRRAISGHPVQNGLPHRGHDHPVLSRASVCKMPLNVARFAWRRVSTPSFASRAAPASRWAPMACMAAASFVAAVCIAARVPACRTRVAASRRSERATSPRLFVPKALRKRAVSMPGPLAYSFSTSVRLARTDGVNCCSKASRVSRDNRGTAAWMAYAAREPPARASPSAASRAAACRS